MATKEPFNHAKNKTLERFPTLLEMESLSHTSYHLNLTVPVLWRRKESPTATTKYVTISRSPATLVVKVKINPDTAAPGSKECATLPEFQAAFLQQEPNKNTYMVLHPARAHWFFTRSLGGCEMFVAEGSNREEVLVIHSNLDKCENKLANLQEKGASVDEMMGRHPGYHLIARVYSEPPAAEKPAADAYMRGYERAHPGILTIAYNNQPPEYFNTFNLLVITMTLSTGSLL